MDRRIPFGAKIECLRHKIHSIHSSAVDNLKLVIFGNGNRYLVDINYISEEELNSIVQKWCYFQIAKGLRMEMIYDYVRIE